MRWVAALIVVSTAAGRSKPRASAASVAIRAAAISGFGEMRSYGRQSQAGKRSTGNSGAKKRKEARIAASRASSRATCTTGPPARAIASAR